jgi:catechol 2,3-dioxygenase-like lactoylglutathione lyase family enzyme
VDLDHLNLRVRDPAACRAFYERWFGFEHAFDADGGHFLRNPNGFLLALVPPEVHQPLPDGFHIGFQMGSATAVIERHAEMAVGGVRVGDLEDERPVDDYVTFRCWDPDGTEIEVFRAG